MNAYVINLKDRTDRWGSVVAQRHRIPFTLIRVEAVNSGTIESSHNSLLPPPVIANWKSQCLVYESFLESDDEYAFVFEDDFVLRKVKLEKCLNLVKSCNMDFLQLGYLNNSVDDLINAKISNFKDLLFKALLLIFKLPFVPSSKFFASKLLIREQEKIHYSIVLNEVRAGTHAYIVSRRFAETMLSINKPIFLAADGLFIAIAGLRFLKMGRLRRNMVRQSASPSSITSRFISN